ncbi:ABC transporter substrate-binding protein [Gorillibacterium massiliense]|uniref:ABC transporter substrate-binding protein n=1 Tax=Gorillibacterium massiliense TaxID=1280390 RepID=UPI0004B84EB1|nr:ABC transporter substrate-binding protein [Gorillibacterium massiliense]
MKLRKLGALALAAVLAVSLAGCGKDKKDDGKGNIKIGANFEMTGSNASFGSSSMKGVKLAVKQINAAGGVLGRQLEVMEQDNASKSEEATRAAQKLVADGAVALIGPVTTGDTMGAVPVAMEKKVPLITTSATNPKVTVDEKTGKVNDWIFRACFIDPFQGEVMANFSSNDLKAKTAVVYVDASSDYSKGLQKFFKQTFEKNGGKIVGEEAFQVNDTDFKAVLTRIKEKNPDVLYVPGYYNEVGKIVKQARELGITIPILGGDGWDSPKLVEIAGKDALNNTFISNHYSASDSSKEIVDFVTAYKADNNNELPDALAALGYDAVKLLADALTRAGSTDSEKLKEALASTKDLKLATGTITLNENHDPVKSAVVLEYKDGVQTFKTKINP